MCANISARGRHQPGADQPRGDQVERRHAGVLRGIAPPGAERAFVADPDVILVGTWPDARESIRGHPLLKELRAVREGHIVVMPNELLVALSQYTADACRDLAFRLHPDRVPKANP